MNKVFVLLASTCFADNTNFLRGLGFKPMGSGSASGSMSRSSSRSGHMMGSKGMGGSRMSRGSIVYDPNAFEEAFGLFRTDQRPSTDTRHPLNQVDC